MEILIYSYLATVLLSYIFLIAIVIRAAEISVREAYLSFLVLWIPIVNIVIFGYDLIFGRKG